MLDSEDQKIRRIKKYPTVSIVIPAYNEEDNIVETINSVVNLDYPKDKIKLIVVDDGSKDKTYERAKAFIDDIKSKHSYIDVLLLTQKNHGKYYAMNHSLKYVDTDFFATMDADSIPNKDALKNVIASFVSDDIAAVSSVLKVYKPKTTIQIVQWFEYSVNHFYKSLIANVNSIHVLPGPLSVYRTKIIKEINGFREAYKTEDMEIVLRIQQKHYKIIQCNTAFVYTKAPAKIKELYTQRHRWNFGTFKNLIKYRSMMLNKKYGDFGLFQLPIILISGILGITILGLILYTSWKTAKPTFKMLQLYNYNIIEYLNHSTFNMILLDIDLKSIVTFIGFFAISILVIWLSLRLYKEKYTWKRSISFALFLFFYYLFLAVVWLGVFKDVMMRKEAKWKK